MTREQIEKVAGEYSGIVLGFKDNPVVMNKHKAFMDGAQWRINSVWHDIRELPKPGRKMLVNEVTDGSTYQIICDSDTYLKCKIYKNEYESYIWAYVSDLLPEEKEETK